MAHPVILAAILTAVLGGANATGQTLRDPTRPPEAPEVVAQSAARAVGAGPVGVVMATRQGGVAVVGGKPVEVGSRTARGVVVSIQPDAVVVRSEGGALERLPLYPAVQMEAVDKQAEKAGQRQSPRQADGGAKGGKSK